MENVNNQAPVTPVELLTRQLADWETLHADLQRQLSGVELDLGVMAGQDAYNNLVYCETKILELQSELEKLK